jgi:hypothetical protein
MSWNYFGVVDANNNDSALTPILSDDGSIWPVELEPQDGESVRHFETDAVRFLVKDATGKLVADDRMPTDLKWHLLVTDSRVITYCEKFDKGGGWFGIGAAGAAVALTANAVSKARAASRRKGKLLVGHIRYPWLKMVSGTPKVDLRTVETIRLWVLVPGTDGREAAVVQISLKKGDDALTIAECVANRAATYRLIHDASITDAQRLAFIEIATASRREPAEQTQSKRITWAHYEMPTGHGVARNTAFLSKEGASR